MAEQRSAGEERIEVPVDFLKPGSVLNGIVYAPDGTYLFPDHTVWKQEDIDQLHEQKIGTVYYTPVTEKMLLDLKNEASGLLDKLAKNIDETNGPDVSDAVSTVNKLLGYVDSHDMTFIPLLKIREHDDLIYAHSVNVGILSMALAKRLKLSPALVKEIGIGALLHDIGKLFIPKEILYKKEKLTNEEIRIIQEHPVRGHEILKLNRTLSPYTLKGVLSHHERFDGSGYPHGNTDTVTHISAKIVGICDTYDALRGSKPYRKKFSKQEAMQIILNGSGTLYNSSIVECFINELSASLQADPLLPVGKLVVLNTGEIARVVRLHETAEYETDMKPVVEILVNTRKQKIKNPFQVDLRLDSSRAIVRISDN